MNCSCALELKTAVHLLKTSNKPWLHPPVALADIITAKRSLSTKTDAVEEGTKTKSLIANDFSLAKNTVSTIKKQKKNKAVSETEMRQMILIVMKPGFCLAKQTGMLIQC